MICIGNEQFCLELKDGIGCRWSNCQLKLEAWIASMPHRRWVRQWPAVTSCSSRWSAQPMAGALSLWSSLWSEVSFANLRTAVAEAAKGLSFVALPQERQQVADRSQNNHRPSATCQDSEDWQLLQEIQLAQAAWEKPLCRGGWPLQVRSQGLDEATGQAIIVRKNGRAKFSELTVEVQ